MLPFALFHSGLGNATVLDVNNQHLVYALFLSYAATLGYALVGCSPVSFLLFLKCMYGCHRDVCHA